jgi:putative thioredoxin
MESVIIDATDSSFAVDVIDASRSRPVVVDLWAEWCAPCRSLGPVLEKLAVEKDGAFLLAKVDVDRNPGIAQTFQASSIPAVKALVDGQVVDEFVGALPEQQVRVWLDGIVPSGADKIAGSAAAAEAAGDLAAAEAGYRSTLEQEPGHVAASLGLARVLLARGAPDEAEALARPLLPDQGAERVLAAVRVSRWAEEDQERPGVAGRSLAAAGRFREALEDMMLRVGSDPEARQDVLDVFAVLGDEDELTREFRPKLAAALF